MSLSVSHPLLIECVGCGNIFFVGRQNVMTQWTRTSNGEDEESEVVECPECHAHTSVDDIESQSVLYGR